MQDGPPGTPLTIDKTLYVVHAPGNDCAAAADPVEHDELRVLDLVGDTRADFLDGLFLDRTVAADVHVETDDFRRKMEEGLSESRFGVVVVSTRS